MEGCGGLWRVVEGCGGLGRLRLRLRHEIQGGTSQGTFHPTANNSGEWAAYCAPGPPGAHHTCWAAYYIPDPPGASDRAPSLTLTR